MNTSVTGHIFYLFILPDPPIFCPFGLCAVLVARTKWVCKCWLQSRADTSLGLDGGLAGFSHKQKT